MLHIKHQIIDNKSGSPLDIGAILGLDLTKAFDICHEAILEGLERLGMGKEFIITLETYFLTERQPPSGWKHRIERI